MDRKTEHAAEQTEAKDGGRPDLSEFLTSLDQVDRSLYTGRCADIFFAHDGPGILKWLHYLPIYDRLFAQYAGRPVKFLEIGVLAGGSMHMWREYFGPLATIFGIDINPECAEFGRLAGEVRIGSQNDPDFLQAVVAEMGGVDIVLDDGSHVAAHQRTSLEVLYPLLREGGLYVIEDLHTSYWADYEGGLKRAGTALEDLKDLIDRMHELYFAPDRDEAKGMAPIGSITFFDSIAAIEKRVQHPRRLAISPMPPSAPHA